MSTNTGRGGRLPAMWPFVAELLRPYRGWLAVILLATGVDTLASLAAPWPLKIVLDDVLGGEHERWVRHLARWLPGKSPLRIAALAAIATVLVAALGAIASYVENYYTEWIGQRVAADLRAR